MTTKAQKDFKGLLAGTRIDSTAELSFRRSRDRYRVPHSIDIQQDADGASFLEWSYDPKTPVPVAKEEDCLIAFTHLHDADDEPERVARFARRYGLLGVCEHQEPRGPLIRRWRQFGLFVNCDECRAHLRTLPLPEEALRTAFVCLPRGLLLSRAFAEDLEVLWGGGGHHFAAVVDDFLQAIPPTREPIAVWTQAARELRAILNAMAAMSREYSPHSSDLTTIRDMLPPEDVSTRSSREAVEQAALDWMEIGLVQAGLVWQGKGRSFRAVSYGLGLVGTLGSQLASALCSRLGFYTCDFCGTNFTPAQDERRPRSDKTKACLPTCRLALRAAEQRARRVARKQSRAIADG